MGKAGFRLVGVVLALVSIGLGMVSAFSQPIGLQPCGSLDLRYGLSGCLHTFAGQQPTHSPSGNLLAMVSASGDSVEIWRTTDAVLLQTIATGSVYTLVFSPDETLLAIGSSQEAELWQVADGTLLRALPGHAKWVFAVAFSPDGSLIATGATDDPAVRVWRSSDGTLLQTLAGHPLGTEQVQFSPDGSALAAILGDGSASAWRTTDWHQSFRLSEPGYVAEHLIFAPDSRALLLYAGRLSLRLLSTTDGALIRELQGDVTAFSPDGTVLATAGAGLRLWRVADGAELHHLDGHRSFRVYGLAFSPDGTRLASAGGYEGTIRIWRVADGALVRTVEAPNGRVVEGRVLDVSFLTDGATLISRHGYNNRIFVRTWSPDVAVANLPKWLGVLAAVGFGLSLVSLGLPMAGQRPRPAQWVAGTLLLGGSCLVWGPVWLLRGDMTNEVGMLFGFLVTLALGLLGRRRSLREPRRRLLDQLPEMASSWGRR